MTEDEAKTKWCHAVVASHTDPRAISKWERPELGLPANTFLHACIGSACTAWRWNMRQTNKAPGFTVSFEEPVYERTGQGYCGLAGSQP